MDFLIDMSNQFLLFSHACKSHNLDLWENVTLGAFDGRGSRRDDSGGSMRIPPEDIGSVSTIFSNLLWPFCQILQSSNRSPRCILIIGWYLFGEDSLPEPEMLGSIESQR